LLRAHVRIQELFAELDGLRALAGLLTKETQNAQLLYLVGFNIWLLSYEKNLALKLKELGVIGKLVAVAKVNVMEKVIRITFAILRVSLATQGTHARNKERAWRNSVPRACAYSGIVCCLLCVRV
jgi:hypothetical protein